MCLSGHIRFGGQGWSPRGCGLVLSLCHPGLQNIFGAASCIQESLDTIGSCTWLHPRDGRSCIICHFCTQNIGMREAHLIFFQTLQLLSDVLFVCFFMEKQMESAQHFLLHISGVHLPLFVGSKCSSQHDQTQHFNCSTADSCNTMSHAS